MYLELANMATSASICLQAVVPYAFSEEILSVY